MAMQVSGNYSNSGANYAEKVKEKQAAERFQKAKKAARVAEEKETAKLSEPQDEYISSEKSGKKPTGLYWIGQDENNNRKIFYDNPRDAHADGKEPKVGENRQGKSAEKCVTNTDKVDREIKKLKEKKQKLEQQIQSASGDDFCIRIKEKQKDYARENSDGGIKYAYKNNGRSCGVKREYETAEYTVSCL